MSDQRNGGIAWTDQSWNPIRGCSRVSAGCAHCYAERTAARFAGQGQPYHGLAVLDERGPRWTGEVRLVPEHLDDPLLWRRPRRIFVNSMSDLFHESLDGPTTARIFAVMARATRHTFQCLTKRADRMREIVSDPAFANEVHKLVLQSDLDDKRVIEERWPLPNVWLGVSVEHQEAADERIPHLLATPAAVRWLSVEPMLGPVDLGVSVWPQCQAPTQEAHDRDCHGGLACDERSVDWVVIGGESGAGARAMRSEWAQAVVDQCRVAMIPVFMKQMGSVYAKDFGMNDRAGKTLSEFPVALQVREYPR